MKKFYADLTEGSIIRNLIRFSWPFLLSTFLQALYNIVDMLIAGWYVGPVGISAINTGGFVTHIVTNLIIGFTVGGTILVAQYLGAKQHKELTATIGSMFSIYAISAVFITGIMLLFCEPILHLLQTPAEAFADAQAYLTICISGTVFIFGYNAVCAMLRGMGDSVRPMVFVAIATGINIALDLLFVGGMGMRAAGAALATVIAQAASFVISVVYLMRNKFVFDFRLKSFRLHADKVRLLLKIGLPSSAQSAFVMLSFAILVGLANSFGVATSAAVGIASKVNGLAILPGLAMGSSISSMAGQNLGACLYDRAKHTMYVGMRISLGLSVLIFALVQLFPQAIFAGFTQDPDVLAVGVSYIRIVSFDYILASIVFSLNALATASGQTWFTLVNSIFNSLLRAPLALLLVPVIGTDGIAVSVPVATLAAILISIFYVQKGSWRTRQINHAGPDRLNACP